jgi:hypothetical protein
LAWVRAALWLLPFSRVLGLVDGRAARAGRPASAWQGPGDVDRAVRSAATFVPKSTCLVRAFAGRVLLARAGRRSGLRLGVARRGAADIAAHAWLECEDGTVVGDRGGPEFASLVP